MPTDLRALREELADASVVLQAPREGLEDILRLNTGGPTQQAASALLADFARRENLIFRCMDAVDELIQDGWPVLPRAHATREVEQDIESQLTSIEAAAAFFTVDQAQAVSVTFGDPQPK